MTSHDPHDASADSLDLLMTLAPDPARAERVRARCRVHLERSQRRAARTTEIAGFASRVLGPVVVGALCVFYSALFVAMTVELERIFH